MIPITYPDGTVGQIDPSNWKSSLNELAARSAVKPNPFIALARDCPCRGIKTGCGCLICNRDHREVRFHECIACKKSEISPDSSERSPA